MEQSRQSSKPTTMIAPVSSSFLQRKCACGQHTAAGGECAECRKKRLSLQRKATGSSTSEAVPPIVHEVLRSPGQPLDAGTRVFMEPRFGHDFSQVRVHTDAWAAESTRAVNALAYTVGNNMVFAKSQYAPSTTEGRKLIAHELTHVIQQQGAAADSLSGYLQFDTPGNVAELEAKAVSDKLASSESIAGPVMSQARQQVSRQIDSIEERASSSQKPQPRLGSTLPYREATELAECIRIMGEANTAYCRQTVLGEAAPMLAPPPGSLTVNPIEVQPRGTGGTDTATVTVTGATPGTAVKPMVTAAVNSGGHQHQNLRPVGTIHPASRNADATGRADFTYRSNLPGGLETIAANVAGGVQADIDVRVPDLVQLPAGADYDLVGQTPTHPDNHFGTAAMIASLQRIAANYEAHKVANNLPTWPRVGYNDISLERGGIFDINGDWAPPHQTHRVGQTVDFRTNHLNAAQRAVLRGIIIAEGGAILNEGNHWHLTF